MSKQERLPDQAGFALILAILALMLLTFLGLTMATTTSTELQIATNYRWSQQAMHNAEAGLEASKIILANASDPTVGLQGMLPAARPGTWSLDGFLPHPPPAPGSRDFENATCDHRGGLGYGLVVKDATSPGGYQYVSTFLGADLNGAFTVWVRRPLVSTANESTFSDDPDNDIAVVTVEGIAPYVAPGAGGFAAANQAVAVLETTVKTVLGTGQPPCESTQGQVGLGSSGSNAQTCSPITQGGITGHLPN